MNHRSHQLVPVDSPAIVEQIANANHATFTHTAYAASVTLGEVVYFWPGAAA